MLRNRILAGVLSLALCGASVACGGGAAPSGAAAKPAQGAAPASTAAAPASTAAAPAAPPVAHSAGVQQLIEEARKEGELSFVLSANFFGDHKGAPRIQEEFNRYYGLQAKITPKPGPSMPQNAVSLIQEVQAGKTPSADLYHGSDLHIATFLNAGAAELVNWRELDPRINELSVAEDGAGIAYASSFAGITYNSNAIREADAPRSLQDVLDPKWKGKVASTPYVAGFPQLSRSAGWGTERTKDYLTKLADQSAGLIDCGSPARLLSGEFAMLVLNCGVAADLQSRREGKPIGFVLPADALQVSFWSWAVPKGSARPALAKLLALFMVSEAGQRLSWELDYVDLHYLPGSQSRALVQPLLDGGSRLLWEDAMPKARQYYAESGANQQELQRIIAKQ